MHSRSNLQWNVTVEDWEAEHLQQLNSPRGEATPLGDVGVDDWRRTDEQNEDGAKMEPLCLHAAPSWLQILPVFVETQLFPHLCMKTHWITFKLEKRLINVL